MTLTEALLAALVALIILVLWRAEIRHQELYELLTHFATMTGDLLRRRDTNARQ